MDILFAKYLASFIDQPQVSTVDFYIKRIKQKAVLDNANDLATFLFDVVP